MWTPDSGLTPLEYVRLYGADGGPAAVASAAIPADYVEYAPGRWAPGAESRATVIQKRRALTADEQSALSYVGSTESLDAPTAAHYARYELDRKGILAKIAEDLKGGIRLEGTWRDVVLSDLGGEAPHAAPRRVSTDVVTAVPFVAPRPTSAPELREPVSTNGPVATMRPELNIGGSIGTRDLLVLVAGVFFFFFGRSRGWF